LQKKNQKKRGGGIKGRKKGLFVEHVLPSAGTAMVGGTREVKLGSGLPVARQESGRGIIKRRRNQLVTSFDYQRRHILGKKRKPRIPNADASERGARRDANFPTRYAGKGTGGGGGRLTKNKLPSAMKGIY